MTITTQPLSQRPLEARIASLASIEEPSTARKCWQKWAGAWRRWPWMSAPKSNPASSAIDIGSADLRNSKLAQDAEVARLGALADQQRRNVVRYRDLLAQGFISDAKMDELVAQQQAIEQQWAAAKAQA